MSQDTGAERSQRIARLYTMTKAAMLDGIARGYSARTVRRAVARYCYCSRGDLGVFAAHEVMQAATFMAALECGAAQ